jgi:hypothetical protein
MKWRHSLIYLVILILLGAYFYYFEVLKKEEEKTAEKEAKRVFHFDTKHVRAVELIPKDNETVRLKNEDPWKIVDPIQSDVDKASLTGFLSILQSLTMERRIAGAPEDLKPYGLQEPVLKIRFQINKEWEELSFGDKAPVGDRHYAKIGNQKDVLLIDQSDWNILNKRLDDLRRRELFTFNRGAVRGISIMWNDNGTIDVEQSEDANMWVAPDRPQMSIRASKVEDVVDQIYWLRAEKFLENQVQNLGSYGLESAHATVKLRLEGDQEVHLRLGKKAHNKERMTALSSELPAVVEVAADFLEELPKSLQDLEDRSFFTFDTNIVKQVRWQIDKAQGNVVRTGEDKWRWKTIDGKLEDLKEPWRVNSFLWELHDAEYERKVHPTPDVPAQIYGQMDLWMDEERLGALMWEKAPKGTSERITVWAETGDQLQALEVNKETLSKLKDKLGEINLIKDDQ